MTRHTPDDFLDLYLALLKQANTKKNGKVEVTIKRYDLDLESKLPESCDKTGTRAQTESKPKVKEDKQGAKGNKKKATKKSQQAAAAKPVAPKPVDLPKNRSGCIVRVKFDKRKVSCVVPVDEIDEFQRQFGNIFREHSTSLVPQGGQSEQLKKRIAASTQMGSPSK